MDRARARSVGLSPFPVAARLDLENGPAPTPPDRADGERRAGPEPKAESGPEDAVSARDEFQHLPRALRRCRQGDALPRVEATAHHDGHDRLPLAVRLSELDDVYDTTEYANDTPTEIDEDVMTEANRITSYVTQAHHRTANNVRRYDR